MRLDATREIETALAMIHGVVRKLRRIKPKITAEFVGVEHRPSQTCCMISETMWRTSNMGRLAEFYIRLREFQKGLSQGQTMTEYALILAAVAVVVFAAYATMGNDISALVNRIDTDLAADRAA